MRYVSQLRERVGDERGTVLILVALSMTALMGFMALSVDVGLLFRAKRNLQMAADAAATAGALEYYNTNKSDGVSTAALAAATANGISNGGGTVVTVTNPVTSGAHTGPGTVEVDITQPNPTFFMKVFGRSTMQVGARAVAGTVPGQACMYVMGGGGVSIQGNSTIQGVDASGNVIPACGMYVKSNVNVKGASNDINVDYLAASGTLTGNHNTNPAPVITGAPTQTLPPKLAITPPAPTYPGCNPPTGYTTSTSKVKGTTYTLITASLSSLTSSSPRCYGLGTYPAATTTMNLTLNNVTIPSGLWTFDLGAANGGGNLIIGSNVSGGDTAAGSTAAGVTLNLYTGNFTVSSTTSNMNLAAPHNGAASATDGYDGVLLLEPVTNTGTINIQWGSSTGKFVGIFDAPGASMSLQDNGGLGLVTGFVVSSLSLGTGVLDIANYSDEYAGGPFRTVTLVE